MSERWRFRDWLRIQLVLSVVALVVTATRSFQTFGLLATAGAPQPWRTIALTEGSYWLAWSLWAGVLVLAVRALVERPRGRPFAVATAVALVAAPVLLIPLLVLPAHRAAFAEGTGWPATLDHVLSHNALPNLLFGATLLAVVYGYFAARRVRRLELAAARLHGQLADAQLETLRARLDPHFLFNALNSIAVLARRGQADAVEQMIERLSGLLRYSLESSQSQLVTLDVELAAVRRYLEIERVRYGDRLDAAIDVPPALLDWMIPSFLLQPLVENAIRHGFRAEGPLRVEVGARAEPGRLVVRVADDGTGLAERAGPDGVGLGHTRARLEALYGGDGSLTLSAGPGDRGAVAEASLPAPAGAAS